MKVIADSTRNAYPVLRELLEFEGVARDMALCTAPYKEIGAGRSMPRFISETAVNLKKSLVKDFQVSFQAIDDMVIDGTMDDNCAGRLHDALFTFSEAQKIINAANCVLAKEEVRVDVTRRLRQVIGDLVVFVGIQFNLHRMEELGVPMSVHQHCEKEGITPDVLWGLLLQDMVDAGQNWYAWEVISPMYPDLVAFDPSLVAECEEAFFPLFDEVAQGLVTGRVEPSVVRGQLAKWLSTCKESAVDVTPKGMLSRMSLG